MPDSVLPELHCHRCVYTWTPRRTPVRMCPRCKSKLWKVPKIRAIRLGRGWGINEVLGPKRNEVLALLKNYGAREVRVFGSVRRQEASAGSDLDLLVDDLPRQSILGVAHLKVELRKLLGRPVDVVEVSNLPWAMRPQIESEAVLL
jgi:predicted nucleotidyltransferase